MLPWVTLRGLGVLSEFDISRLMLSEAGYGERGRGLITFKVLDALVAAVVLASRRVVPFYAEPGTGRAGDLPDVPDRADEAVVGQSLTDLGRGRHDGRVSAARYATGEFRRKE